ncbi:PREDICTED: trefoil factor 1-like [Miniopterus natalensis]|uniref:trefoil factor 1-like n=1 Tax=Miniopterus natalensis TaxID=291302 RepID=UPI0007A712CD|nr:PREDICTED: trefoil factor 1-like [Miniopterus natalensis]
MAAMEPKVVCVLLVVFSLALSTLAQGQIETCTMAPTQRINCGYPGVTPSECAEKGCCFDNSVIGHPWCFYPLNTPPEDVVKNHSRDA